MIKCMHHLLEVNRNCSCKSFWSTFLSLLFERACCSGLNSVEWRHQCTVIALFWQAWKGGSRYFMILGLCVFLHSGWLTSSWWKEPLAGAAGEGDKWQKGQKGNLTNMPSSTTRLSSTVPYLLFPSISYSTLSSSSFSSSSSSCYSSLRMFGNPPGPPSSPAGTWDRHWPPFPPGSKMLTGFKLFIRYKIVTGISRIRFSGLCNPDRTWRTNLKTTKELKNQKQN